MSLNINCPICTNPLTSKTEATRGHYTGTPMWASDIHEAERDGLFIVGVCYPCGEMFDFFSAWTEEDAVKVERKFATASVLSVRSKVMHRAKATQKPAAIYAGQTREDWNLANKVQYIFAKQAAYAEMLDELCGRHDAAAVEATPEEDAAAVYAEVDWDAVRPPSRRR
jgi:hypothetical protein